MFKSITVICLIFIPALTYGAINKNLNLGSRGPQVSELQSKLIKQGFLAAGNDSGYFGKNTQLALKQYQAKQNISATGSTGPKTRASLNETQATSIAAKKPLGKEKIMGNYTEFVSPSGFVNTDGQSIRMSDYVGEKVILVSFITYSCINCQRTFPYMNSWYEKYKDQGLVVVGIHAPEFAYEKKISNVQKELTKMGVKFPVILDNDFATWGAYKNQFWPHRYIIDLEGNVVYDHIGEGKYQDTEDKIKSLLGL